MRSGYDPCVPRFILLAMSVLFFLASRAVGQALPASEAFERLGESGGAGFQLADDVQWADDVARTTVPEQGEFWARFLAISRATGYEPLFVPYENQEAMTLTLRRVDVAAEESVTPAIASGVLLVRPIEGNVTRDLITARATMRPMQVTLGAELFLEPGLAWLGEENPDRPVAIYATAAGLRSEGKVVTAEGRSVDLILRRAAELDPTVSLRGGIGRLSLGFDADTRMPWVAPTEIGPWRALVRVVIGENWQVARFDVAPGETAPPLKLADMYLIPAAMSLREPEEGPRRVTVQVMIPRRWAGETIDLTEWVRLYGFLQAIPPKLDGPGGVPWTLGSYIVAGDVDETDVMPDGAPNPLSSGAYRVWATFTEPVTDGAQTPATGPASKPFSVRWTLPTAASERRVPVIWQGTTPVLEKERKKIEPKTGEIDPAGS